jgi:hypothetical protein
MCPVKINWHVKQNSKDYWRVKITITNLNFRMNYTEWNLGIQHPNFDNITQLFGLNYKPWGGDLSKPVSLFFQRKIGDMEPPSLFSCPISDDIAMFWGVKSYNDVLMQDGKLGMVQSELLLRKDSRTFTFEKGWAFPRRVYFNGDNCVMPSPEDYPSLPMQAL